MQTGKGGRSREWESESTNKSRTRSLSTLTKSRLNQNKPVLELADRRPALARPSSGSLAEFGLRKRAGAVPRPFFLVSKTSRWCARNCVSQLFQSNTHRVGWRPSGGTTTPRVPTQRTIPKSNELRPRRCPAVEHTEWSVMMTAHVPHARSAQAAQRATSGSWKGKRRRGARHLR